MFSMDDIRIPQFNTLKNALKLSYQQLQKQQKYIPVIQLLLYYDIYETDFIKLKYPNKSPKRSTFHNKQLTVLLNIVA